MLQHDFHRLGKTGYTKSSKGGIDPVRGLDKILTSRLGGGLMGNWQSDTPL